MDHPEPEMPINVALVEDDATLRRRFIERIRYFDDIDVVLVAQSGEDFFEQLESLAAALPDVVLMDIRMPGMSGIEATQRLGEEHPDIDVMMLTVFEDDDNIFRSVQAGACGYLLKDISAEDLVAAVLELHAGGAPMSPNIARRMLTYVRSLSDEQTAKSAKDFNLTAREIQTLELLVDDLTDLEIGDRLHISAHTVRSHIKNIYKKLHVHSRAAAVRVSFENRLFGD